LRYYCFVDFETTGLDARTDLPIEVAAILTDLSFTELDRYTAIIGWPKLVAESEWLPEHQPAASIHGIEFREYKEPAQAPERVAEALTALCPDDAETVLVSDNIHFDYSFMEGLFERVGLPLPFHYLGFDTGLLLAVFGLEDPESIHRAAADVEQILHVVREAADLL